MDGFNGMSDERPGNMENSDEKKRRWIRRLATTIWFSRFSNALHLCHIEYFAKRCDPFHSKNLTVSASHSSTQQEKRNEKKTKTQIQTIVHLPIPNESESNSLPLPTSLLLARTRINCKTEVVYEAVHAKARQNAVFTVYLLFDALAGDQQFYDYSLRIFLPFLILLLFFGKNMRTCCNENTLMLPMLSYGPCSLFTSAFACACACMCLCV